MPAPTPTTGIDRQLTGSDFATYIAYQTAYNAVNTSPAFIPLRKSSGGLKIAPSYTDSPERPSDREAVGQVQDIKSMTADISSGVSLQSFEMFRAALCGVAEVEFSQSGTTFATTASGISGSSGWTNNLSVGDWIFPEGFTNPLLNVPYRVESKTATAVVTYPVPAATETAGAAVTVKSFKTATGDTPTLMIMQDRMPDDTAVGGIRYKTAYNGFINTASLTVPENGPLTYAANIQFEKDVTGTAAISGQTDSAATTDDVLTALQNIEQFIVNGTFMTCTVKSMSFEFNNNNQTDNAAGCGQRFGLGQISLGGSIAARSPKSNPFRFRDWFEAGTSLTGLGVILNFGSGKKAVIMIDKAKITEHDQSTEANVVASSNCSYSAEKGQYGKTLRIFRNFS